MVKGSTVLSIIDMNDRVFAEFRRITGSLDGLLFPPWWAEREREVIRLQDENDRRRASSRWVQLERAERQARLLSYLASLPIGWTKPIETLEATSFPLLARVA